MKAKIVPHLQNTFIDKSTWAMGPWKKEPDKVQWTDAATGLPCLAVRHPHSGHWCGYVGVIEGHPAFGLYYDDANKLAPENEDEYRAFDVHFGLTYSAFCQEEENAEEQGVCHVPQPGEPEKVWWLGFDCAHYPDISPRYDTGSLRKEWATYKTLGYVQKECAKLARQLKEVDHGMDR